MIIDSLKHNGPCSCGREHKMQTELCVIESGALKKLGEYLENYSLKGYTVAVYDDNTYKAVSDRRPRVDFEIVLQSENLHANEHGVELLFEKLPERSEIVIAVGSGTVHDIVRYCAYKKQLDFVSCPTAASVDGFCSSVAAMTWHGCKKTLNAKAPRIVVADIDIIKNAPLRLARSGFGDMIGKYVALTDWKIANILTEEFYCSRIADLMLEATKTVENSIEGIIKGESEAFENLTFGLLMSGLAMQMMGNSRPASGAEHHISHMIEMEPEKLGISSDALHGEKVGVGTLLAIKEYQRLAFLENVSFKDYEKFDDETILGVFGADKLDDIRAENTQDVAESICGEILAEKWESICKEINALPDAEYLKNIYVDASVKSSLSDIGVDDFKNESILKYSPMVRNRLTLMRLKKCIK